MNATAKFYTGFFVALVLVVALCFYAGYRTGYGRAVFERTQTHLQP